MSHFISDNSLLTERCSQFANRNKLSCVCDDSLVIISILSLLWSPYILNHYGPFGHWSIKSWSEYFATEMVFSFAFSANSSYSRTYVNLAWKIHTFKLTVFSFALGAGNDFKRNFWYTYNIHVCNYHMYVITRYSKLVFIIQNE